MATAAIQPDSGSDEGVATSPGPRVRRGIPHDRHDADRDRRALDEFIMDDVRIRPESKSERFTANPVLNSHTANLGGVVALGAGVVDNILIQPAAAATATLSLYDTDSDIPANNFSNLLGTWVTETSAVSFDVAGVPITFRRGLRAEFAATGGRAFFQLRRASGYGSEAVMRRHGQLVSHPGVEIL